MEKIDMATRRELFLDHYLIDKFEGAARLKAHPPRREEVVFQVEGALENASSGYYVLVKSADKYLLYYRGLYPIKKGEGDESAHQLACVAVSDDGIHFERPELKIFDLGDGGRNNVVWQGIQAHNFVPFLDANPACREEERYKAVGGTGKNNLYALYSPDGFHWRLAQDAPLDIAGAFDSANVPLWDGVINKYRLFSRFFDNERVRSIQSCMSDDFIHWTRPVPHEYDKGAPIEQFYTNATVQVPGAGHILLSFPMRYFAERTTPVADISAMDYPGSGKPGMAGMTDAVMMSSRDGVNWQRPFPEAWLRPGLDERNWTHRNTMPAIGILPLKTTEWSMYVSEHYGWPDNRLRRLSLRPWGFGSIHAGYNGGKALTRPLSFAGSEMRINFSTSAAGSVRVELRDENGNAIPGYALEDMNPVYGDELDRPLSWKGSDNVGELAGRPVRLCFELKDADVFSVRCVEL